MSTLAPVEHDTAAEQASDEAGWDAVRMALRLPRYYTARKSLRPTVARMYWRFQDDGTVRVVAIWWGRRDVARRTGFTVSHPRQGWDHLHDLDLISFATHQDRYAYRAFLMLGRCNDPAEV